MDLTFYPLLSSQCQAPVRAAIARPVSFMAVRSFTAPSAPLMKDVIKELYIKELQNYKPAPETKGVDASQVKDFKAPAAPQTANIEIADALNEEVLEDEEEEVEEAEEAHH
ncbi:hypothetical protein BGZ92_003852 [Podila epicladia]|nr:hypothetical protein BGZ92_003852 [Podila epicladia]